MFPLTVEASRDPPCASPPSKVRSPRDVLHLGMSRGEAALTVTIPLTVRALIRAAPESTFDVSAHGLDRHLLGGSCGRQQATHGLKRQRPTKFRGCVRTQRVHIQPAADGNADFEVGAFHVMGLLGKDHADGGRARPKSRTPGARSLPRVPVTATSALSQPFTMMEPDTVVNRHEAAGGRGTALVDALLGLAREGPGAG